MPEMDGIELISRRRREMPAVLCVIVSGYSDFEYMKAAIQQSAADYLLKPVNPEELKRLLQRLEATLLAREQQMIPRRESDAAALAERVRLYLQENYDQPVDFSSLADSLAVSAPYLSKLFHEQEGKSPSRYLTDLRMRKAQKLLMDTQLTVREIAVRVGYPDPFHFSRNFKNAMGISPAQFREERAGKERKKGDGSGEED
jgi:YesN/AraC family two-component response regulator